MSLSARVFKSFRRVESVKKMVEQSQYLAPCGKQPNNFCIVDKLTYTSLDKVAIAIVQKLNTQTSINLQLKPTNNINIV